MDFSHTANVNIGRVEQCHEKKTLKKATDKYNLNLQCDAGRNINQVHKPVTITTYGQLINPNYNMNWEMYMT